ncbi:MAG: hypothetical protein FWF00_02380 [Endomicrobia bacterium]|nr:hypothetical protein [Endomicrobiia bacterium]MCL2506523.1 hypothetical protein [Endomicrobiia bacterium]
MKKTMKKIICLCFVLTLTVNAYAASGGAAFLRKGVGARALGMGGAFTSVADDTSAIYWNPAGLGKIGENYSVTFMTTSGASDAWTGLSDVIPSHSFFAGSLPAAKFTESLGKSVFALGFISSSLDNIVESNDLGVQTGTFDDTQSAFYLSWGMPIWEDNTKLYVGASFKYVSEKMNAQNGGKASGYDMDLGVMYNVYETLNFGVFLGKGASMKWDTGEADNAPLLAKFGVSNKFDLNDKFKLLGALDLVQAQKEPLGANLGVEFSYVDVYGGFDFGLKALHLRSGINSLALESRYGAKSDINKNVTYSIGFGVDVMILGKYLQLDYAMSMGNLFDNKNKISLNFYF